MSSEFINLIKNPVINPNTTANTKDTSRAANCKPPCFTGFKLRAGDLPFRPPQNIALNIPPSIAIIILSMG